MAPPLPPEALRRRCDESLFRFRTTAELPPLPAIIGQDRALHSIDFGLDMPSAGFNIYVLGESGTGKKSAVRSFILRKAAEGKVPRDWCYVNNFRDPAEPLAVSLDPGRGQVFRKSMADLVAALRAEIPKVLESKEYKLRRDHVVEEFQKRQKELFTALEAEAEGKGFNIRTAMGEFTLVALGPKGEPLTEEEFAALDGAREERIRENGKVLRERIDDVVRTLKREDKATKEKLADLERQGVLSVLGYMLDEIRGLFPGHEKILSWLDAVREDILRSVGDFKSGAEEGEPTPVPFLKLPKQEPDFTRYAVNVVVDNGALGGAPCVFENNPTYYNLFGRIQHRLQMGMALSDFTMIKAGSLHAANGGFLVIDALDLLRSIFSYDSLKRAIRDGELRIEDVWEQYRLLSTATLKPEPIPLDVKIILIGNPEIYYLLFNLDEEYRDLFKVKADFDNRLAWTDANALAYADFVGTKAKEEGLLPFDPSGVARIVEYGARLAESQDRLSSRFSDVSNLIRESHCWAQRDGASVVSGRHVARAWQEKVYRHCMIQDRMKEVIDEGTLIVETAGERIGQVNGLAVIDLGDYSFGKPSRITTRVFTGKTGVVNIERESKLSGKIHDKAVLILANYLGGKYAAKRPISLTAAIAFEQLYGLIEGDSATCAELYSLLSALSGVPLRQSVGVTGSMDQNGNVQPVGGVNEKIEGFFDLCRTRGLDGTQGVVIPRRNVRHLMLKEEVVEAVREGRFQVFAVDRVEEAIEVLMGMPPGEEGPDGLFPDGTVNRLVADRLEELRQAVRAEEAETEGVGVVEEEEEEGEEDGGGGS